MRSSKTGKSGKNANGKKYIITLRTAEVDSRTDMHPLSYTVQQRQLKFLGHSIRCRAEHYTSHFMLSTTPHRVDPAEASPQHFTLNTYPKSSTLLSPSSNMQMNFVEQLLFRLRPQYKCMIQQ